MVPNPLRVLLVDDWDSIRRAIGMAIAFENDIGFEIIGEASDGRQAVMQCEDLQPDLVIMDIYMPRMDGIMATRQICQKFPHIHVIILTISPDIELIQSALNAGAIKVVLKDNGIQGIKQAVHEHLHWLVE